MSPTSPFPQSTSSLNASEGPSSDTDPFIIAIHPHDQVSSLVSKYSKLTSPGPALSHISQNPAHRRLLYEVLEQHLRLVKSRSQAFEDAHITVYDKALLEITANGNDLYHVGASQLFIDEVVGVTMVGNGASVEDVLKKNVALKALLMGVSRPVVDAPGPVQRSEGKFYSKEEHGSVERTENAREFRDTAGYMEPRTSNEPRGSNKYDHSKGVRGSQDIKPPRDDKDREATKDSLTRMMETFRRAQHEYINTTETDVVAKCHAAKFLRDTAENALTYLRFWRIEDHPMVPELQDSLETAREKAIALSGGRKRHFETVDAPVGPRSRGPPPGPPRPFPPPYRGSVHQRRDYPAPSNYRKRAYDAARHGEPGYQRHDDDRRDRYRRY